VQRVRVPKSLTGDRSPLALLPAREFTLVHVTITLAGNSFTPNRNAHHGKEILLGFALTDGRNTIVD
jgi:hypothetical protein